MNETFGQRFAKLRKEKGLTQEDIAFKVNISSQAVSKWENNISFPDVSILVQLAEILDVTTDELLGKVNKKEVTVLPKNEKKDINKMFLRIIISDEGNKVKINIPIALLKICIETGTGLKQINGNATLSNLDWNQIYGLIENGVIGEIITIEGEGGEQISIIVE